MSSSITLPGLLLAKIEDQCDRALHLISQIPEDKIEWRPLPDSLPVCEVLGHLLECLAGFCAALHVVNPQRLAHFSRLRELPVNHCCKIDEARARIAEYAGRIREGFELLTESDLSRRVPTVFVPEGEAVMTILLGNLEHFTNHKYQLFFYLKLAGVPVRSEDLYLFK